MNSPWDILGVSPSSNVDEVKRAYRSQLKLHKPEVDPVGFKRVREAYESALAEVQHSGSRHPGSTNLASADQGSSSPNTSVDIDEKALYLALDQFDATIDSDLRIARAKDLTRSFPGHHETKFLLFDTLSEIEDKTRRNAEFEKALAEGIPGLDRDLWALTERLEIFDAIPKDRFEERVTKAKEITLAFPSFPETERLLEDTLAAIPDPAIRDQAFEQAIAEGVPNLDRKRWQLSVFLNTFDAIPEADIERKLSTAKEITRAFPSFPETEFLVADTVAAIKDEARRNAELKLAASQKFHGIDELTLTSASDTLNADELAELAETFRASGTDAWNRVRVAQEYLRRHQADEALQLGLNIAQDPQTSDSAESSLTRLCFEFFAAEEPTHASRLLLAVDHFAVERRVFVNPERALLADLASAASTMPKEVIAGFARHLMTEDESVQLDGRLRRFALKLPRHSALRLSLIGPSQNLDPKARDTRLKPMLWIVVMLVLGFARVAMQTRSEPTPTMPRGLESSDITHPGLPPRPLRPFAGGIPIDEGVLAQILVERGTALCADPQPICHRGRCTSVPSDVCETVRATLSAIEATPPDCATALSLRLDAMILFDRNRQALTWVSFLDRRFASRCGTPEDQTAQRPEGDRGTL